MYTSETCSEREKCEEAWVETKLHKHQNINSHIRRFACVCACVCVSESFAICDVRVNGGFSRPFSCSLFFFAILWCVRKKAPFAKCEHFFREMQFSPSGAEWMRKPQKRENEVGDFGDANMVRFDVVRLRASKPRLGCLMRSFRHFFRNAIGRWLLMRFYLHFQWLFVGGSIKVALNFFFRRELFFVKFISVYIYQLKNRYNEEISPVNGE